MATRIFCARCQQLLAPHSVKGHSCPHGQTCAEGECAECEATPLDSMKFHEGATGDESPPASDD